MEHGPRTRACRLKNPSGMIGWAGHNNCSSALIGGYGYLSVKWEQTQKFAPILFFYGQAELLAQTILRATTYFPDPLDKHSQQYA